MSLATTKGMLPLRWIHVAPGEGSWSAVSVRLGSVKLSYRVRGWAVTDHFLLLESVHCSLMLRLSLGWMAGYCSELNTSEMKNRFGANGLFCCFSFSAGDVSGRREM